MTEKPENNGDSLSTVRLEALSDGVFAIVLTLLILEVKIPAGRYLPEALMTLRPILLTYLISFVMLGVYWVAHHNLYHYIRRADRILLWLNLLFLLFVSFLPFTTALLGNYFEQPLPSVLFGLNLICIGLSNYLVWCYATIHHRLTGHGLSDAVIRIVRRRILVAPAVGLIAILVSYIHVTISLLLYFLLPLYYIWPGKIDEFWRQEAVPHEH